MDKASEDALRDTIMARHRTERRAQRARKKIPVPIDVRAIRVRSRLTQEQFARRFGFSVSALRHWEQGTRRPRGPSLVLLNVISHNPGAVFRALKVEWDELGQPVA